MGYVLLDRDGTINADPGYLSDPGAVELLPGAAEGLRRMREMGLGLIVVTNQSAIGRGYFDLDRLEEIHERLREILEAEGVALDAIYFCPHKPDDGCSCRKPGTGMVEKAMEEFGFDPEQCFMIGDKESDIELGRRVGATTFLIRSEEADETETQADYVVDDLAEAAEGIKNIFEF